MGKYIVHWEVDATRTPEGPKERQQQLLAFGDTVGQQLKSGEVKEWGGYVGELNGYAIIEGTEVDVHALTLLWVPFVKFKIKPLLSIEQSIQATKSMKV